MPIYKEFQSIVDLHFGPDGSQYAHELGESVHKNILEKGFSALPIEDDIIFRKDSALDVIKYFMPQCLITGGIKKMEGGPTIQYLITSSDGREQTLHIGQSSGTTRKRISVPWLDSTFETAMANFEANFRRYGISANPIFSYATDGLFELAMNRIAQRLGSHAIVKFYHDLGQLKRLMDDPERKDSEVKQIIDTVIKPVLHSSSRIGTFVTFPPILEALDERMLEGVETGIIGGFGTTHETYWNLKKKYKGNFAECYGNILWTWAFGDDSEGRRDFFPPPFLRFEIVKPNTNENLGYYQFGQVVATRCTPELLVRWKERDAAMLIPPREPFKDDGVRDVKPLSKL